ncbi:MAG: hypothetical protein D6815_03435 [Candidatus Dadabacteria bacterium]|nr:MAG: hypothetical protein D6815_03435 [Candidatus Dadabacteria bacterium]
MNAAFLGALGLVLARAQLGVEPVAECVRSDQADDRGVIVVHRAGWNGDLGGLRGRRFGFVDRGSAAGYLFPLVYFRERGVDDPARFFGRVFYAGSHDLLFQEVARGGLDGGAGRESVLRELTAEQPRLAKTIAVIARSGPLPGETFVLAPNLKFPCFKCHDLVPSERLKTSLRLPRQPKDLKTLLSQLLLGLHDSPEGASVLAALGAERFVEPDPARWRSVLELLERAGINPEQYHP